MGQDADATLKELDATRASLERDIDALFARLPEADAMKAKAKTYGAAAGGAAATIGLVALQAKKRSELKARRMDARINAEELARAFSPHEPPEPSGRSPLVLLVVLAAIAGAVVAALRLRNGQDADDEVVEPPTPAGLGTVDTGATPASAPSG